MPDYCDCCECYHEDDTPETQFFRGTRKVFPPENSFGSSRAFGVELETESGYVVNAGSFAFDGVPDGSIDGTEYVSHILRGDAGLAELKAFMAAGEYMETPESCGLHIHVDMRGESEEVLWGVFLAFKACEEDFADCVDPGRSHNSYCAPLDNRENLLAHRGTEFSRLASYYGRYYWLNIAAYGEHGTFENRLHEGTWEFAKVEKWVKGNLRFVELVKRAIQSGAIVVPSATTDADQWDDFTDKARHCFNRAFNLSEVIA